MSKTALFFTFGQFRMNKFGVVFRPDKPDPFLTGMMNYDFADAAEIETVKTAAKQAGHTYALQRRGGGYEEIWTFK
jgi:hypothetical protein